MLDWKWIEEFEFTETTIFKKITSRNLHHTILFGGGWGTGMLPLAFVVYVVQWEGNIFTGVCLSVHMTRGVPEFLVPAPFSSLWSQALARGAEGTPVSGPRSLLQTLVPGPFRGGEGYPTLCLQALSGGRG